jgi:hypothetical protein
MVEWTRYASIVESRRTRAKMKNKDFVVGIIIGIVVGFLVCRAFSTRYTAIFLSDGFVLKIDTFTGKTWISALNNGWTEIPDRRTIPTPSN